MFVKENFVDVAVPRENIKKKCKCRDVRNTESVSSGKDAIMKTQPWNAVSKHFSEQLVNVAVKKL